MRSLALALLLLALAGCGGASDPPEAGGPLERLWADQALSLLDGLDGALQRITDAGVGPGTLADESYLYSALLGYSYVDSCGEQLAHLGQPSSREREVDSLLRSSCRHLRHASALFSRAVKTKRAALLRTAAAEALATGDGLHRARALLEAIP